MYVYENQFYYVTSESTTEYVVNSDIDIKMNII